LDAGSGSGPGGLLPGEHLLWTGRPGRVRVTASDVGVVAYLVAALAVVAVFGRGWLSFPLLLRAIAVIVLVGVVVQVAAMLVDLTVVRPRRLRREVYQVTNWRVIVTAGLRVRRTWSAYLDQIGEPQVRRDRDGSENLVLSTGAGALGWRLLGGTFGDGPFSSLGRAEVPVLRSLADAAQAQQVIAAARQRMLGGHAGALPPRGGLAAGPLPGGVELEPGEGVLWAGQPGRVPWWFGAADIYLSAFGLVWLACAGLMCAFAATAGSGATLAVMVPLALAGGAYPAIGRIVHRRMRIRRSAYLLTYRRLIVVWRLTGTPVTVQARLGQLGPPAVWRDAVFADRVSPGGPGRPAGWKNMLWPAATTSPPALIGITSIESVRDQIAAAQLTLRTGGPDTGQLPQPAATGPE
jgi:hypothetical protein